MRYLVVPGLIACWLCLAVFGAGLQRQPNTSLQLPEKPAGFNSEFVDALGLQFDGPVAVVFQPGDNQRVFVAELAGRIIVITNLAVPTKTTFLDLTASTVRGPEEGLLALALHPDFASNGRLFVHRSWQELGPVDGQRFNQISEFHVATGNPNAADPAETVLIRQPLHSHSHMGGDLHFGPDGYLYGSFGDNADPGANSQQIDGGFFSAIWRIDVDGRPGSLLPNPHPSSVGNYRIPPDNPYVGATNFLGRSVDPAKVRTEFWAVGLRNPFRFSFDSLTGDLWVGDVGQDSYESIFASQKGANHGWPDREGVLSGVLPNAVPADFLTNPAYQYVPPVYGYDHDVGHSVIGGLVYRGSRWPSLAGYYLFADHSWGFGGALRRRTDGLADFLPLNFYQPYITHFSVNPNTGDIWVGELGEGRVRRLDYSSVVTGSPVPETLAATGAFSEVSSLTPAPGVVPYEVNQSFWSDGAQKRRWFSVPDPARQIEFKANGAWNAPVGTVWVKHFDLELTEGVAATTRRLETRLLVRNAGGVYGVTYRWDSLTNATLVPEAGMDEDLVRVVGGQTVTQRWHYPGRNECLTCHNQPAGWSLGFSTAQLNRDVEYDGLRTNQIAALIAAGYLTNAPGRLTRLPVLAEATNTTASLEWRTRSYLAANCAPCHRPGGVGLGLFDARLETPTLLAGLINGTLLDSRGDSTNRVVVSGDAFHSVLLQKLSLRGSGQMPPLASNIADPTGEALLRDWIESLGQPPVESPAELQVESIGTTFRLHGKQPANQWIHLEMTTNLSNPDWLELDIPGTEMFFPAEPRDVLLQPAWPSTPAFFRLTTTPP